MSGKSKLIYILQALWSIFTSPVTSAAEVKQTFLKTQSSLLVIFSQSHHSFLPFPASFSPQGDRITAVVPVPGCDVHSVIYVIVTLYLAGSGRVTQIVFLPDKNCPVDLMLTT